MMIYVPIDQFYDNPFQTRREYSDVAELAASIQAELDTYPDHYGLLQIPRGRLLFDDRPVTGDKLLKTLTAGSIGSAFRVQLAFGHRRLRAFTWLRENSDRPQYRAGVMPVILDELSDDQMLDAVWSENINRADISAVEQAHLLQQKLARLTNQRELAETWGLARSTIANRLRLLDLPADIQQANRDGRLSERQCLSLAPVIALNAQAGSGWNKGKKIWNPPPAPADYLDKIIHDDTPPTSDEIRAYTSRALQHAGEAIPPILIPLELVDDGLRQATCRGCPQRINNTCLDTKCLQSKRALAADHFLAIAARDLGLQISRNKEHFLPFKHDRYKSTQLADAWEQKLPGDYVIGWQPEGFAVRPFAAAASDRIVYFSGDPLDNKGRTGIVIGLRGALPDPIVTTPAVVDPDAPAHDLVESWKQQADAQVDTARKAVRAALISNLEQQLSDFRVLLALVEDPASQRLYETDPRKNAGRIVDVLWKLGRGISNNGTANPSRDFNDLAILLNRANIDRAGILDENLAPRGIRALASWHLTANISWTSRYAQEQIPELQAAIQQFDLTFEERAPAGEVADLRRYLGHALTAAQNQVTSRPDQDQ